MVTDAHISCCDWNPPKVTSDVVGRGYQTERQPLLLFLVQELGVTYNVDEEDMSDLQMETVVGFQRHDLSSSWAKAGCLSLFADAESSRVKGFASSGSDRNTATCN
jgi:hypothetical protein